MNFEDISNEYESIQRVSVLDKILIRHPSFDFALKGVLRAIVQSHSFKEPVGCMLLAEGGMGKTKICEAIISMFQKKQVQNVDAEITHIPAFYTEVPSPVSVSTLASNMLEQLNDPSPLMGTIASKTKRIVVYLKTCETRIILLDEVHNLLNNGRGSEQVNTIALRWLKSLVNNSGVCICLVGVPECETIIDSDPTWQQARRFKYRFRLSPLQVGTAEKPSELYHFLTQMCSEAKKRFALVHMPMISNYQETLRMYAATRGNLSFVMTIIREAILQAWRQDRKIVELEDFAFVWDMGVVSAISIAKNNPFRMSDAQVAAVFRK
ncbi:TniB family NTP-binding protein [Iodobacter arcticus]|uniref:TniB family NTP-binding protein n=1 Tax=Iodobacter arcticus TaxID=590593 RepID=A0ABW2R2H1_9NEIS